MSGLKLAVFDVDGTLIDSREIIHRAMDRAFMRAGLGEMPYDRVRTIVGLELSEAIARLAPPDIGGERLMLLCNYYKEAFVEQRADPAFEEPLYEGALDTLVRLSDEGWLLGVATGKARRGLDIVFGHHGLHRYFQTLQTVDHGIGKPHPRMVLDAMAETGVRPEETVVIGDTSFDMLMARSAGTRAYGVSWGFHTADEIASGGAHEIHDSYDTLNTALSRFVPGAQEVSR